MKLLFFALVFTTAAFANTYGYLTAQDQKYYKNDSLEGNNQRERIDSTVKEINKLHGEVSALKSEVQMLRKEVEDLKKSK